MSLLKSLKTLLGFSLLGLIGVWIGCSSDASPVASYSASKTHTAADTSPADPADPPTTPTLVDIPDLELKALVRAALVTTLELRTGSEPALSESNLERLTKLDASTSSGSVKIQSLEGLQFATNLDTLYLSGNSITDVSPLDSLTSLKVLNLDSNWKITDVSSLSSLTSLEVLNLNRNKITDVSSLSSLTNLEELYLYANYGIRDVSPLSSLTNLKRLAIGGNPLAGTVSSLSSLTNLVWLKANAIGIGDNLSRLSSLTTVEWLDLKANGITDVSPLTCLPNLKTLKLKNNHNLSDASMNTHVPYLRAKGVAVLFTD